MHPEVDCIVTVSGWNSYTKDVKERAVKDSFGVYVVKEFAGALNLPRH